MGTGMIHVSLLDPALLPGAEGGKKRLIFIGDIHGCKRELDNLLLTLNFNEKTGHLVAVGDIVNKGPDSLGVIDSLRSVKASCVRGNHEDRLLSFVDCNQEAPSAPRNESDKMKVSSEHATEKQLAKALSHGQLSYLRSFPLVLRMGHVNGIGDILVVHAGLVPGLPIELQHPSSLMNMRIIDLETHLPSKKHHLENHVPWTQLWDHYQSQVCSGSTKHACANLTNSGVITPTTVIYGHNAKRGLQLSEYTRGLDSGCVKGGKLTALVVDESGSQDIVQVDSQDYTSALL